jgi:nicotinamidase/pyrazinamidase
MHDPRELPSRLPRHLGAGAPAREAIRRRRVEWALEMTGLEGVLAHRRAEEGSSPDTALLIVDVEADPSPVPRAAGGAEGILPVLRCYLDRFHRARIPVFASRDGFPSRIIDCEETGESRVRGSRENARTGDLLLPENVVVVSREPPLQGRGCSAFAARSATGVPLERLLRFRSIRQLCVAGVRTEQAVWATVLDARRRGFQVVLLLDAIHGGDRRGGETARALDQMLRVGTRTATLDTIESVVPEAVPQLSDSSLRKILPVDPGSREPSD